MTSTKPGLGWVFALAGPDNRRFGKEKVMRMLFLVAVSTLLFGLPAGIVLQQTGKGTAGSKGLLLVANQGDQSLSIIDLDAGRLPTRL